ncbi:hypothetical protein HaLaN_16421 [Haematococcus lacustris]|uniref:Uncharacterized protein n=1 Tax=Haematococcus lacustris TaxID=44745 RepID=A0A699ZDV9_HAELA|nr:hypothetical protein HaLaN_16421 [Haematococcus lacustris]
MEAVMGSDLATEPPVSVSGGVKTLGALVVHLPEWKVMDCMYTVTKRGQKSMADDEGCLDEKEREAEETSIVRNTPGQMLKWMFLLFSVLGAPNVGGFTEHRSSRFTYTFSLSTWMTKNVNGFEYLRLCEGRDRYLCSELYMTPDPVSFSRPHR